MSSRGKNPSIHPVLVRFAINERAFRGLISYRPKKKKRRRPKGMSPLARELHLLWTDISKNVLNGVIIICLMVSLFYLGPRLYFAYFPLANQAQAETLEGDFQLSVDEQALAKEQEEAAAKAPYVPPFNENLPEGDWLIIPRIGVRSTLQQTEHFEDALDTGIWWAPDFGTPGDRAMPMIVAGHRFGWKWWWENDYWKLHSFYMLPDLEPGDTVEVISGQRKYQYEIYAGEEGLEITDYTADLIIYTCKHLDSPVRVFRYARLVLPPENT